MKTKTDSRTAGAPPGSLHPVVRHYVVLWDDEQGVCCPMGWDEGCDGALCCITESVALFDSRKAARKAIDISAKFAQLRRSQGKPVNLDFIGDARKKLRVVPCRPNVSDQRPGDRDAKKNKSSGIAGFAASDG